MNKNIKNQLKILKNIVADADKKAEFRNVLLARVRQHKIAGEIIDDTAPTIFDWLKLIDIRFKPAPMFAALMIFIISGASVGAAFASQDSLPGELLYPIKIVTEKAELAVTRDETKKTNLHLEFAAKRLNEAERIIDSGEFKESQIDNLFANYQNELNESQKMLEETGTAKPEIAVIIDQKTEANKKSMAAISEKIQRKIKDGKLDKKYEDVIEEANERAEKTNDAANIFIFAVNPPLPQEEEILYSAENETKNSTSTENLKPVQTAAFSKKSNKKIKTAEEKISETEKHIAELKKEGYTTDFAEQKIKEAKTLLEESKSLADKQGYQESLLQSIQARQMLEEVKKMAKRRDENKENKKEGGTKN